MAVNDAAISVRGLVKSFILAKGIPLNNVLGPGHWLAQMLIRAGSPRQRVLAVDGVDLDVHRGECLGLLGPNGAGKTTLLKCIATLLKPDAGTIIVNGLNLATEPARARLSITLVGSGQWVSFDWALTVRQNLQFFADLHGMPRKLAREHIDQAMEALGITNLAERTPMQLSAGERQRAVLARALVLRSPVLFLDEPTANLDPTGTLEVLRYVRERLLRQSGTTVVYTTHRMDEAEELCDRVAIMHRGRIVALDQPAQLLRLASDYEHLEVDVVGHLGGITRTLEALEGVQGVTAVPNLGGDGATLRVQCQSAYGSSSQVAEALALADLEILAVRPDRPRLGDVLLALTRGRQTQSV